jgi:ferrous iron transport protein A
LVPNARLEVVRSAPLDDPVEVRIEDTILTLRRAEAAHVQVMDV